MSGFQAAVLAAVIICISGASCLAAENVETGSCDELVADGYDHNRFGVSGSSEKDVLFCFSAFQTSFDSNDDDDSDGHPDLLRVPQWVAQEIMQTEIDIESGDRPNVWMTDKELAKKGIAPTDDSYRYSKAFLSAHKDWYQRGHLAQKYLAERISQAAAYNTHTLLNAVPQRARFNAGIWLDIECKTGAWANHYGHVWVVSGPIFLLGRPNEWIGESEKKEKLVGVPDALFKVVIREGKTQTDPPSVLAFIYPQTHPGYAKGPYDHRLWLTSIARVQVLTGLQF